MKMVAKMLLCCLILMASVHAQSIHAANDVEERQVLEELYRYTSGPTWVEKAGWLSGDPCKSAWYGILCNQDGHIIGITLTNNKLAGQIPSSISGLKYLQVLRLFGNNIGGIMPQSLFTLTSLKILDISSNLMIGSLPSDFSLPLLTNISVAHNQLEGFLPTKWNCPLLEYFEVQYNMFQGPLPSGLAASPNLQYLDVSNNHFSGKLPPELGQLSVLRVLWITNNNFDSPELPSSWEGLLCMRDFRANGLSGVIPEFFGDWANLEHLYLNNGQLNGSVPQSLCGLRRISTISFAYNSLSGTFPECLCKDFPYGAVTLTTIDFSSNHLTGPLPDCFDNLYNFTNLNVDNNNISGELPPSFGLSETIKVINVSSNRLTGSVPYSYANLVLDTLYIDDNKLNSFDKGLDNFFKSVTSCSVYDNPWSCPLPNYFNGTRCRPTCSKCNSLDKHNSCNACVGASECGWCKEGPNCLEGTSGGPTYEYKCQTSEWIYGNQAECNN
jgi:Leucine-rich repeat (LRR) protein